MIPTEACPRCGEPTLPHDMHDERICGDCCRVCHDDQLPAPDPAEYLPRVLVGLALNGIADDILHWANDVLLELPDRDRLEELLDKMRKAAELDG